MNKTHVRPIRDLRNNYAEIAEIVKKQGDHVIITNRGRGDMVLIDFDDYAGYEQYLHQKYIDAKLREAIDEAKSPDAEWIPGEQAMKEARDYLTRLKQS